MVQIKEARKSDEGMYQCFVERGNTVQQKVAELRLGSSFPHLLYQFKSETLRGGSAVSFKCSASGSPPSQFSWTLDGFPLPENPRYMVGQYITNQDVVISHLNISDIRVEDGGNYKCTAENGIGSASHAARLNVYGLPYIRSIPPVEAIDGSPLVIHCPVAGYPIHDIAWNKGNVRLSEQTQQLAFENGSLVIPEVRRARDGGSYTCSAKSPLGHQAQRDVTVKVIVEFAWERPPGTPLLPDEHVDMRKMDEYSIQLVIKNITSAYNGKYACVARNNAGRRRQVAELVVNVPPRWSIPPQSSVAIKAGDDFAQDCQATGFPEPKISWHYSSDEVTWNEIPEQHPRFQVLSNGTLYARDLDKGDEGLYACHAANGIGSDLREGLRLVVQVSLRSHLTSDSLSLLREKKKYRPASRDSISDFFESLIEISVDYSSDSQPVKESETVLQLLSGSSPPLVCEPPKILSPTHGDKLEFKSGGPVRLACISRGDLPLRIIWNIRERQVAPYGRYKIQEENSSQGLTSVLIIDDASRGDSGEYMCQSTNAHGEDKVEIEIKVLEPPSRPESVEVVKIGSRFVELRWRLPPLSNEDVKQFIVLVTSDGGLPISSHREPMEQVIPAAQSDSSKLFFPVRVIGLSPATSYKIQVQAENQIGRGDVSPPVRVTTEEEGKLPSGPPLSVEAEAVSSTSIRVHWMPPQREFWNGVLLGYYIGFLPRNDSDKSHEFRTVQSFSESGTETTLKNLQPFTTYDVVVQAFNSQGPGVMSPTITATTKEDVPLTPPEDVTCSQVTSTTISLSWRPPRIPNGVIRGYVINYFILPQWEEPASSLRVENAVLRRTLRGLQPFSNYSISLLAFTAVGEGVLSAPITCFTLEDVPSAPAGIKVLQSSRTSFVISWLPPTSANGILTKYTMYIKVMGRRKSENEILRLISPDSLSYEASGLQRNKRYSFWMTASTSKGQGKATKTVDAVLKDVVPASIVSFGRRMISAWKMPVTFECVTVGDPEPQVSWWETGRRNRLNANSPRLQVSSVALAFRDITAENAGNYSCVAENAHGRDEIVYELIVRVPPRSPELRVEESMARGFRLSWTTHSEDASVLQGYILSYRPSTDASWREMAIARTSNTHMLLGLKCGSPYHIYLSAFNQVGQSKPSKVLDVKTKGEPPVPSTSLPLFKPNATSIRVMLDAWTGVFCEIQGFRVWYRLWGQPTWNLVAPETVPQQRYFEITGLLPNKRYEVRVIRFFGFRYEVRVTARSAAGETTTTRDVQTLMEDGSTGPVIASSDVTSLSESPSVYRRPEVIVPTVLCVLIAAIALIMALYCRKRNMSILTSPSLSKDAQLNFYDGSNHHPTLPPLHCPSGYSMRDFDTLYGSKAKYLGDVPSKGGEINPYATFQLPSLEPDHYSAATLERDRQSRNNLRLRSVPVDTSSPDGYYLYRGPPCVPPSEMETLPIRHNPVQDLNLYQKVHHTHSLLPRGHHRGSAHHRAGSAIANQSSYAGVRSGVPERDSESGSPDSEVKRILSLHLPVSDNDASCEEYSEPETARDESDPGARGRHRLRSSAGQKSNRSKGRPTTSEFTSSSDSLSNFPSNNHDFVAAAKPVTAAYRSLPRRSASGVAIAGAPNHFAKKGAPKRHPSAAAIPPVYSPLHRYKDTELTSGSAGIYSDGPAVGFPRHHRSGTSPPVDKPAPPTLPFPIDV
ncbi:unnamed protein product [Cyprideis torosa]|uniref:Uncharacterized protein n=1 Tax=Cyprideis torosa TaxID=163714 RepID=A0A7R8ZK05_9CRUS|nr:unnamed protein product [Cyprideis torosa]CAG0880725.1 unnamed protein product [Cyprideis torosa]